jgi:hypothetical protein
MFVLVPFLHSCIMPQRMSYENLNFLTDKFKLSQQ